MGDWGDDLGALSNIIADELYSCAVYGKKFDLLNTQEWKQLKRHARTARRLIRTLKRSKYRQAKVTKMYKHGWKVPRDYVHALQPKRLEFILCLMSGIVENSRQGFWMIDTLPRSHLSLSTQELIH